MYRMNVSLNEEHEAIKSAGYFHDFQAEKYLIPCPLWKQLELPDAR